MQRDIDTLWSTKHVYVSWSKETYTHINNVYVSHKQPKQRNLSDILCSALTINSPGVLRLWCLVSLVSCVAGNDVCGYVKRDLDPYKQEMCHAYRQEMCPLSCVKMAATNEACAASFDPKDAAHASFVAAHLLRQPWMTHAYLSYHLFIPATSLMHICVMTHAYVRHDSFIHATGLIHTAVCVNPFLD